MELKWNDQCYICVVIDELKQILAVLAENAGDTVDLEVKKAEGGLPDLTSTLCALSNLPGGGRIVLGLDESDGFAPVSLPDLQVLKQGLTGKARSINPPVGLEFRQAKHNGLDIIIVQVGECPASSKPARVRKTGEAWLRGWDGDYRMSDVEIQGFLRQRDHPAADRQPVSGTSQADLDSDLVAAWQVTVEQNAHDPLVKFAPAERLVRTGAVTPEGELTVAGLLALGQYPQQYLERMVVSLAAFDRVGTRASEAKTLTGSIPDIIDGAMAWARSAFPKDIVQEPGGSVRDRLAYPLEAFRELISNALIHRDLEPWSQGRAIEVRLTPDALRITSPGGLYGLTVDQLGNPDATSARNKRLAELCRFARTRSDSRVVELYATGLRTVLEAARKDGLPTPKFVDRGISFTVVLNRAPADGRTSQTPATATPSGLYKPTEAEQRLLAALGDHPRDMSYLEGALGISGAGIRRTMRKLREQGLVKQDGGPGRTTHYRRI